MEQERRWKGSTKQMIAKMKGATRNFVLSNMGTEEKVKGVKSIFSRFLSYLPVEDRKSQAVVFFQKGGPVTKTALFGSDGGP